MSTMKQYFYELSDYVTGLANKDEVILLNFSGENSEFVRFNNCKIRQGGHVDQYGIGIKLIRGSRSTAAGCDLSHMPDVDQSKVKQLLEELRGKVDSLPDDPYLTYSKEVRSSESIEKSRLPHTDETVSRVLNAFKGKDLVGIYASGNMMKGFANSLGQRNWFEKPSFNFDFSIYYKDDKAVKSGYAGFEWDDRAFDAKVQAVLEQYSVLTRPPKTVPPGQYRVYLSPAAFSEFVPMFSWGGGLGYKSYKTKQNVFIKMDEENHSFHPSVNMLENTKGGISSNFQSDGFIKPDSVSIIKNGKRDGHLISPRSSKEYLVENNGAEYGENPNSFEVKPGNLVEADVLKTLDTGVYINNTWYLNFSDRKTCRITGMTRFASFWVEGGKIQAPLNVMRFDESALRMLGDNLIGLTRERDFIMDASTYFKRSDVSMHLPGVLADKFTFTL